MVKSLISKAVLLGQVFLFVIFCTAAWPADPPSSPFQQPAASPGAVEKSLQPKVVPAPAKLPEIVIEEEGAQKLGESGMKFPLEAISFEDNLIFSPEQLQEVVKGYLGKTIEVNQLTQIADTVTAFYKENGYFLTRAYVPPQTIKDGRVAIKVREGRLGSIIINGNKRYSRDLIRNTLKIVRGEGAVRTADVERALLLLMDNPGLHVKVTFKPGSQPATSDMVIDVQEDQLYNIGLDYDNFGSKFISRDRIGASFNLTTLTGNGESVSLRLVSTPDGPDELFYGRAEFVRPIGYNGLRLGINYQYMQYQLQEELAIIEGKGFSSGGGVWLNYPFIRSRNFNWFGEAGFDIRDVSEEILSQTVGKDKIRAARIGTTIQWLDIFDGANTISLRGYQGLAGMMNGMDQNDPNAIRHDTDSIYTKVEIDASRIQRLPVGFLLLLYGTGQWSQDRVPSSEQFHIGGAGSVRGYSQGEYSGDSGVAATGEFRIPIFGLQSWKWFGKGKTVGETLQLAAFCDYGKVWINERLTGDEPFDGWDIAGAGVGFRFDYSPYVRLKLDWAKSIGGEDPINNNDKSNGVWYLQAAVSF